MVEAKIKQCQSGWYAVFVVLPNGEEILWDGACHNKEAAEIQAKYVKKFIN